MHTKLPVIHDGLYRAPAGAERALGLWVDRIGVAVDRGPLERLRVLGLYAALAVRGGGGVYYSPPTGEIPVRAGDAMLVFPEVPSLYHPHGVWRTKWIVWGGAEAEGFERLRFIRPDTPVLPGKAGAVEKAFRRLQPLMAGERPGAMLARKAALLDLVGELCLPPEKDAAHIRGHGLVEDALTRIHALPAPPPTVEELARAAGLHPSHFRRLFRQATGCNPKDFILSRRLAMAKELLLDGLDIKEAARRTGFGDVCHFMRLFRRMVGTTAGRYAAMRPARPGRETPPADTGTESALQKDARGID